MGFLRAIGRALAAIMVLVTVWVQELARYVVRCLPGYVPPDPQTLLDEYAEMAETEAAAAAGPTEDQRLQQVQQLAEHLFRGTAADPNLATGLNLRTMTWLEALTPVMLLAVSKAKPDDLRQHLKGQRFIRGLLAADPESVAAYVSASAHSDPAPEPQRRRRAEPLLPAFGPIC